MSRGVFEMSEQSKRLLKVILDSRLSYVEIEKKTGISKSSIQRYASGVTKKIPIDAVKAIADATESSAAWIMGWEDEDGNFPSPNITEDYVTFPVIGEIAAGYEHIAVEDWDGDKIDIPRSYLAGRKPSEFFVLLVKGESMYPHYQDGDRVLILKQTTLEYSGQVGAILYEDEYATLKKVEYVTGEDWLRMVPINPSFPPVKIENEALEHCRVLGIPRLIIREVN